MRILLLQFFLSFAATQLFSQNESPVKISNADSVELASTWETLKPFLLQKSTLGRNAIADTVNCYICLGEEILSNSPLMDRSAFIQSGIPVLNKYKKIRNSVENEIPRLAIFHYENEDYSIYPIWIVTFTYLKKDEVAEGHEGATIFFEFKKTEEGFELFQVSTVP